MEMRGAKVGWRERVVGGYQVEAENECSRQSWREGVAERVRGLMWRFAFSDWRCTGRVVVSSMSSWHRHSFDSISQPRERPLITITTSTPSYSAAPPAPPAPPPSPSPRQFVLRARQSIGKRNPTRYMEASLVENGVEQRGE